MSHTPAPWFFIEEDVDIHDGHYSEPMIATETDDQGVRKHIAVVRIGLEGTNDNGRLMAAAPDLLEACKQLTNAIVAIRLRLSAPINEREQKAVDELRRLYTMGRVALEKAGVL